MALLDACPSTLVSRAALADHTKTKDVTDQTWSRSSSPPFAIVPGNFPESFQRSSSRLAPRQPRQRPSAVERPVLADQRRHHTTNTTSSSPATCEPRAIPLCAPVRHRRVVRSAHHPRDARLPLCLAPASPTDRGRPITTRRLPPHVAARIAALSTALANRDARRLRHCALACLKPARASCERTSATPAG